MTTGPWWKRYQVDVPCGTAGRWTVERFTVDKSAASLERTLALHAFSHGGRAVPAGTYTRLLHNNRLVMSDTPDEIRDLRAILIPGRPTDRVLLHGLGLGVALQGVLDNNPAAHVTVVEKSADVIALVAGHYLARYGDRVKVIHDDAFTWKPARGERWDVVWHDIWDDFCEDNLAQMTRLHRRFGRRCDWQESWGRHRIKRMTGRR